MVPPPLGRNRLFLPQVVARGASSSFKATTRDGRATEIAAHRPEVSCLFLVWVWRPVAILGRAERQRSRITLCVFHSASDVEAAEGMGVEATWMSATRISTQLKPMNRRFAGGEVTGAALWPSRAGRVRFCRWDRTCNVAFAIGDAAGIRQAHSGGIVALASRWR